MFKERITISYHCGV